MNATLIKTSIHFKVYCLWHFIIITNSKTAYYRSVFELLIEQLCVQFTECLDAM